MKGPGLLLLVVVLPLAAQRTKLGDAPQFPSFDSIMAGGPRLVPPITPQPSPQWYFIGTRAASQAVYATDYIPTINVPLVWGLPSGSAPQGDTSSLWKDAVIKRVNFYRAMGGLQPDLVLDAALNSKAQFAAYLIAANDAVNASPPSTWKFYTPEGAATLGKSNLCQTEFSKVSSASPTDPGCVSKYMADQGAEGSPVFPGNELVPHRRWILYSRQKKIGTGDIPMPGSDSNSTRHWNALYVADTSLHEFGARATRETFVAWPPKGYIPYQLVPPRWSFSLTHRDADLSNAVVKVMKDGVTRTQTLATYRTGYGDNTIVFNPDNRGVLPSDPAAGPAPSVDTTYTVTVENVKISGITQAPYVYNVVVFDPAITKSEPCTSSLVDYEATPGYQNVLVYILGSNCNYWSAYAHASWASFYPTTRIGEGSTTLTIYPNFTSGTRTATASVGGTVVTIRQRSVGGTADERFVGQLYYYMLGRMATASEISSQVARLPSIGRAGLANAFLNSPEFAAKSRYIAGLYVGLLNRDAEFAGWQFQRDALLNGIATATSLVTNFTNSPEYLLQHPGQSNHEFVRMMYQQVLLRKPSEAEVEWQVAALAGWNRTAMASAFLGGPEFQKGTGPRLLAFLFYATLLNRDPTAAEMTALAAALADSSEAQRLVRLNQLLTSSEFLSRLQ